MGKLLPVTLIGSGALVLCSKAFSSSLNHQSVAEFKKFDLASRHFKCDGRQYCSQMTSRAEAEFFIKNCPNTKMDGDNDGIRYENDSRF